MWVNFFKTIITCWGLGFRSNTVLSKDHLYRMVKVQVQQYLTKPNHCIWPIRTHYTFVSTNEQFAPNEDDLAMVQQPSTITILYRWSLQGSEISLVASKSVSQLSLPGQCHHTASVLLFFIFRCNIVQLRNEMFENIVISQAQRDQIFPQRESFSFAGWCKTSKSSKLLS